MRSATVLLLALWMCSGFAQEASLKLIHTVPLNGVQGRFDHFAIDAKGQRLFVAALGNNSLEVIDLAAGKRIQSVPGMSKPTGVLCLPYLNQILVANDLNQFCLAVPQRGNQSAELRIFKAQN